MPQLAQQVMDVHSRFFWMVSPDANGNHTVSHESVRKVVELVEALQSQQGSKPVAWIWEERTYNGRWVIKTGLSVPEYQEAEKWLRNARPLVYGELRSKYVDGWICPHCETDNPDEISPCADTEECSSCREPRPLHTYIPPKEKV